MKDLLLHNEKLIQTREEKVQILAAICARLSAIAEKAPLLWVAGVFNPDAAIITGAVTNWITNFTGSPQTSCIPWNCQPTAS